MLTIQVSPPLLYPVFASSFRADMRHSRLLTPLLSLGEALLTNVVRVDAVVDPAAGDLQAHRAGAHLEVTRKGKNKLELELKLSSLFYQLDETCDGLPWVVLSIVVVGVGSLPLGSRLARDRRREAGGGGGVRHGVGRKT